MIDFTNRFPLTLKIPRIFGIILLTCLFPFSTFAQDSESITLIDSINGISYGDLVSNPGYYEKVIRENLELAQKIGYDEGEAAAWGSLALCQYIAGDLEASSASYLACIDLYESLGLNGEASGIYAEFGYSLKRFDLEKSKFYLRKGIDIAEQENLTTHLPNHYNHYGVVMEMSEQLDSAIYYYQKSLNLSKELGDSIGIPYCYNNLAGAYSLLGEHQTAFTYLDSSDQYRSKEKDNFGRIENTGMRGDLFFRMKDYSPGIHHYLDALRKSRSQNYGYMIKHCSTQLSKSYEALNQADSALYYFKMKSAYEDSLEGVEVNKNMARLEMEFQAAKKDKEIAEKDLIIRKAQVRNLWLAILGLILIFVALMVWRVNKARLARQRLLSEKQISDEKMRISRELHDNIGSQLTFMISSVENAGYSVEGKPKDTLEKVANFGRETMEDLRNTVWAMKQQSGKLKDLSDRIRELISKLPDRIIPEFEVSGDQDMELNASELLNLFRLVQEFIQNTIKHSGATGLELKIEGKENGLEIVLRDNGQGFEMGSVRKGNGLRNMETRAKAIGAELKTDTFPEKGVRMVIWLSKKENTSDDVLKT